MFLDEPGELEYLKNFITSFLRLVFKEKDELFLQDYRTNKQKALASASFIMQLTVTASL